MNVLNAKLLPLKGKHYGSQIELALNNKKIGKIKVWMSVPFGTDLGNPSTRELTSNGHRTVEEAFEDEFPCDSHYESELDYRISMIIKKALNNLDLNQSVEEDLKND